MLRIAAGIAVASLALSPAYSAPCRSSGGKFVKCPPAAAAKPVRCKGANGKFAKCGTPGAKPV